MDVAAGNYLCHLPTVGVVLHLVGLAAIGRKMGVTRQRVRAVVNNPNAAFPAPVAMLDSRPGWDEREVDAWLDAHRPGWRDRT